MAIELSKKEQTRKESLARFSRQGAYLLAGTVLVSLLLHISSFWQLSNYQPQKTRKIPLAHKNRVILKYAPLPNENQQIVKEQQEQQEQKSLPVLETPQSKTERPEDATHLGQQDHKAEKVTKVKRDLENQDKDAGLKGNNTSKPIVDANSQANAPNVSRQVTSVPQSETKEQDAKDSRLDRPESKTDGKGQTANSERTHASARTSIQAIPFDFKPASAPRNSYEKLLAFSSPSLSGQVNAGYQDYVEDDVELGDAVDINTQEYRFVGYTTAIRKGLHLVWSYPIEAARRGIQGSVDVAFGINHLGEVSRIRVLKSSGHKILDDDIVEALQLASPFAPPPKGFIDANKKIKLLRGRFQYMLSH